MNSLEDDDEDGGDIVNRSGENIKEIEHVKKRK